MPLIRQAGVLVSYFPDSTISRNGDLELMWTGSVTPSPLSATYKLHLHYQKGKGVKIYVLEPKPLPLAPNKVALPHVYNTAEQELCLYYPKIREWTPEMLYARTLIPWACEWLLHYEIWVATGEWKGGGIEHDTSKQEDLID